MVMMMMMMITERGDHEAHDGHVVALDNIV
jgi:hypothetical protein